MSFYLYIFTAGLGMWEIPMERSIDCVHMAQEINVGMREVGLSKEEGWAQCLRKK